MKWLKYCFLALLVSLFSTAFTAIDNPIIVPDDLGDVRQVDSIALPRRHTEAVKSIAIWGDTLRAESIWRDIIAQDSLYAPALYSLSHLEHISNVEAFDFARRAYVADSSNKWYGEHYGFMLLNRGLHHAALKVYRRLMQLDHIDRSTYFYLARLYAIQKMPYSAIAVLDTAEMRQGRDPYLARFKQDLLFDTRQYERAIEEGERLIIDLPYDVDARIDLARAYAQANRDSLAREMYISAFKIDTTNLDTIYELWDYYAEKDDIDGVIQLEKVLMYHDQLSESEKVERVEYLVDNKPLYHKFFFKIGHLVQILTGLYPTNRDVVEMNTLHLYAGDQEQLAMEYLHEHLNDDNVEPRDYAFALQLDEAVGDGEQYILDMMRAVELFPDNLYFVSVAAYFSHNLGDTKLGVKMLRNALKKVKSDEDRSALWCTIGDLYYDTGETKHAFSAYEKSLDANPENVSALNNYAYYLCLTGERLEEALAMAELAITLEEGNYNNIDTYAWILHLLGRNQEAKKYMQQALSLSSQSDANLLVHYADILWDLGEKFMAETYWKKAQAKGYDNEELLRHIAKKKLESE